MNNPYAEDPILSKVYTDGWEYGVWQGGTRAGEYQNASPEVVTEAWHAMQNGDESFWDQFEESPLSGEWANGPQLEGILEQAGMPMDDSLEYYDYREDAGRAWNNGYNDGLVDGFEQGLAPLIPGAMDAPGNTYLPDEWQHSAATNPVNYSFVPFADSELTAFNALPDRERQRWHARAFNLNRRALKGGQEGRVTGRELYALIHRHDNQCAYCDKPLSWSEGGGREVAPQAQDHDHAGSFDHNIPLNLGGTGAADNLLPTCWHCNKEMNQWDRRNFDKNLGQPRNIEPNPLMDTEPVYARVAHDIEDYYSPLEPGMEEGSICTHCGRGNLLYQDGRSGVGDFLFCPECDHAFLEPEDYEQMQHLGKTAVNKVQAKCPNCGTLNETSVCVKCGKGLEPEWNKLNSGKDVPWESLPQMGTPQNEYLSLPTDTVPKVEWGKQDNQFGTMISHVRTVVGDTENWMVPDAPPAGLEGHGDVVKLQGGEVNRYLEDRFPDLDYNSCPQCGEQDMIDTNLGNHCLNCDYWEEGGKDRKDAEFLATPEGQAYQRQMQNLQDRATVSDDEFL